MGVSTHLKKLTWYKQRFRNNMPHVEVRLLRTSTKLNVLLCVAIQHPLCGLSKATWVIHRTSQILNLKTVAFSCSTIVIVTISDLALCVLRRHHLRKSWNWTMSWQRLFMQRQMCYVSTSVLFVFFMLTVVVTMKQVKPNKSISEPRKICIFWRNDNKAEPKWPSGLQSRACCVWPRQSWVRAPVWPEPPPMLVVTSVSTWIKNAQLPCWPLYSQQVSHQRWI